MFSRIHVTSFLALTVLSTALACDTPSGHYDQAVSADTSITTLRSQLTSAKEALNGTMSCLTDLSQNPQQDLRPQYERFVSSLNTLQTQADTVKSHARDMRNKAEQYFSAWNQQAQQLQDESLRAKANERRDQVQSIFSGLTDANQKLASTWNPFIAHLNDVKNYLGADLSPGGVSSAKDIIDSTVSDSKNVTSAIDNVVAELDKVSSALSAGKKAPPPQSPPQPNP
jgi:chromosome segregation ATPase